MSSPWYADLIYVLFNLNSPPSLTKKKDRFLKLKAVKFFILEKVFYWKDVGGILLKCLLSDDVERTMQEFHEGDCGGHMYWKTTANKIVRSGFYWPTHFPDVHKNVTSFRKCPIFEKTFAFTFEAHIF